MNFDPRTDYYKALGVKDSASDAEIKKAYRKLAKEYHPDRTGGDKTKEARFKQATEAYGVLGDKEKRAQYDAVRAGGMPFGGNGAYANSAGGGVDLGDIFSSFFGGGGPAGPGGFGRDGNVRMNYSSGGAGFESFFSGGPLGAEPPPRRARKKRPKAKESVVRASDGSKLTRRGADVHSEVRLAIDEAILGTAKQVATLGGKASVKIPPGTSSGKRLRLRGKGVPKDDGGRGDHYVTVHIDVPKADSEAAKKTLAEFMKHARK